MFLLNVFEIIGTVAFAVSGALVGMQKKLDLFGIVTLAVVTAIGGGIFRDLFIGNTPPTAFMQPKYFLISVGAALCTFICYSKIYKSISIIKNVMLLFDAIGLGVFTALGANIAINHNFDNFFIVVCMGLISGVGGGMIRDILVRDIPLILIKDIYAVASIVGGTVFYYSHSYVSSSLGLYLCFFITFTLRLISIKYNFNLPTTKETRYHM
ncbi:hypothetical protein CLTEP_12280 [Clostridium tepidiprofundi DSM 19306]|uniref:Glycine transporter domain-containing protein n=1 Tax=Clostridium tepidiprofundi DSM 19306 TaxID=1121338 RepID=A0A151B4N9_9CLOT|nr:trimeric intracellular cation channel family protein [Clostridium tepidiprofundi]KYH34763.1 hypothetical protein CLTEP_12280 [Clostridium tepidiprofundi DSM 19306]